MEGIKIECDVATGKTIESIIAIQDQTLEEILVRDAKIIANKINKLWQAANDYEYQRISGSAIGLITLGVLQGKPKCLAVKVWINSIWTLYYARKATITTSSQLDIDFSSCGQMPFTVPELMIELGV